MTAGSLLFHQAGKKFFCTDPCYSLIGRVSPFTALNGRQPAISCWLSSQKCLLFVSLPLSNVRCSWTSRRTVDAGYLCRPVVMWNVIRTVWGSGGGSAVWSWITWASTAGTHFSQSCNKISFVLKSVLSNRSWLHVPALSAVQKL